MSRVATPPSTGWRELRDRLQAVVAWLLAWRNPAEAIDALSDTQYAVLRFVVRLLACLALGALAVLWVFGQVQSAMPMPAVTP